jgi:glycerol-3-phosphate dehydrogenase
MTAVNAEAVSVDVLILGGGIAGLWTLAKLKQAGYKAVLLESEALGAGQTRFAQGIIHGGTKYALTGKLTASSQAVADMPALWRNCLQGDGEIDLTQATLLSDTHYLWSTTSLASRVSGFFASKVMRSRTSEVKKNARPALFEHADFSGQVYALDEPVFDTLSVVRAIAQPLKQSILTACKASFEHKDKALTVECAEGRRYEFSYQKLVLMAGEGNQLLLSGLNIQKPEMQRRPLKMVIVRGGLTDRVYAHCMGASVNPRVTITSHFDKQGEIVWYLGGQLAEDGVKRSDTEQINAARKELAELIPWLDLSASQWAVLDIDRAEVKKEGSKRPDTFFAEENGDVITAWPTKMALSPVLADHVAGIIEAADIERTTDSSLPSWPDITYAELPWQEASRWK